MKLCKICKKQLIRNQKSTCSWKCRSVYVNKLNTGIPSPFKGMKNRWSEETKRKISEAGKGRTKTAETLAKMRAHCHPPSRKGVKLTPEQRLKKALTASKGENHYKWKGGITAKNVKLRHSIECKIWRGKVFKRDNWTCQECGQIGGDMEAHHIKEWRKFKKLRFSVDNGITYCVKCHKKIDKYRN
jgi:hypothetical protein